MVEANQWEVVGGKGKTKSAGNSKKEKASGKGSANGAAPVPTLKVEELVTPLDTKYAMLDPEMRAQAKRAALGLPPEKQSDKNKKAAAAPTKEAAKKKPAKDSSKEKEKPAKTLPDALKQLNVAELLENVETIKARFAGSRLLWLKELATYLNNNLLVETDATFAGKPRDYPASLLNPDLRSVITSTIQSCEDEVLDLFYDQSLYITIPGEMNRGAPVNGTKIIMQLLSFHRPNLVLKHLKNARDIVTSNESRVPVTLTLLWVLSQPSFKDTRVGIQVWTQAMLPMVSMKNYGAFVAQAAGYLTAKAPSAKLSQDTLPVADYFKLTEQVQQGSSLPPAVRQPIADLVHALTLPMIAAHGSKMFSHYLRRLASGSASERSETCRHLIECLRADEHSFDVWRKEYRSSLPASSVLLQWIADHDQDMVDNVAPFRAALVHFQGVNDSFSPTAKVPQQALKTCSLLCGQLLSGVRPKKKSRSKLKLFNYLLLVGLAYVVYYDINENGKGQFAKSKLGLASEKYGVTAKAIELHQLAGPYIDQASKNLVHLRDVIHAKGEELFPGLWAGLDEKYRVACAIVREQAEVARVMFNQYADMGLAAGAEHWAKFLDWSKDYRKQASVQAEKLAEVGTDYYQQARKLTIELWEKEQVQQAVKYTVEMYHKALHAVGLCSH